MLVVGLVVLAVVVMAVVVVVDVVAVVIAVVEVVVMVVVIVVVGAKLSNSMVTLVTFDKWSQNVCIADYFYYICILDYSLLSMFYERMSTALLL